MRQVQARWYHKGRISPVRVIVIHSMEAPEGSQTAENVANYFRTTGTQASAHVCVDSDSAVRCVPDSDTAWAAPGANADGLQLELAGYARQTKSQWLDAFGKGMLAIAARVCADWCVKYDIPPRRLTRAELKAGKKGFTSHADVSAVYKRSDHHDPGSGFPWDYFLAEVQNLISGDGKPRAEAGTSKDAPPWPGRYLAYRGGAPMTGDDVRMWQRQMRARGWVIAVDGIYGEESARVCTTFQDEKGLAPDGIVGPATWEATWEEPVS